VLKSLVFFGANLWYWIKHGIMGNSFDINSVNYHHYSHTNKTRHWWYVPCTSSLRCHTLFGGYYPLVTRRVPYSRPEHGPQPEKSVSLLRTETWFTPLKFRPYKLACGRFLMLKSSWAVLWPLREKLFLA
jgi:hypothetical protein